jgi:hypothetical protein
VSGRLGRLDERVVPALGRALRGTRRVTVASVELTGPPGRFVGRALRRYPVAIAAVALIAVAALLIVWTGGDQQSAVRPKPSSIVPPLTGQQLGPVAGTSVSAYLDAAALRSQQLSSLPANQQVIAVVDFNGYLSPLAVPTVLGRQNRFVRIVRGFAQVPPPANGPIHVLSTNSSADLSSQLAAARSAAETVLAQYRLAFRLYARHPTAQREAAVSALSSRAGPARVDVRGLSPTCGCIFSVVVTGPASAMDQIANLPDVRVLDPAPPSSSLQQLAVVPLEPQASDVVPPLEFAGE